MFFRVLKISLILAYLLCGYHNLSGYPYLNTLKDISFVPHKSLPSKTFYTSIAVSKHYPNFNKNQTDDVLEASGSTQYQYQDFVRVISTGNAVLPQMPPVRGFLNKAPPLS